MSKRNIPITDDDRLSWLSEHPIGSRWSMGVGWTVNTFPGIRGIGPTFRDALDAAMRQMGRGECGTTIVRRMGPSGGPTP